MLGRLTNGAVLILLAGLAGCGPNYSPNTYSAAAVQQANKVERGVVVGVRPVGVSADSTVGTVTGGAAGGIVGSQAGPGGAITALSALGGTVVGGLVGNSVAHATGDTNAFEYIVREADNSLVSVTQKDKVPLEIGQTVLVIAGKQARIVPDYTVPVPSELAATGGKKAEPETQPAAIAAAKPGAATAAAATPSAATASASQAAAATPSASAGSNGPVSATAPAKGVAPAQATAAAQATGTSAAAAAAPNTTDPPPLPPPMANTDTPQPNAPISLALPQTGSSPSPASTPPQGTAQLPQASKP